MALTRSTLRGFAAAFFTLGLAATLAATPALAGGEPLDADDVVKYLDALPIPAPMPAAAENYYEIGMYPVVQQLHSQFPPTMLWGYGTSQATASYPAATIEARRGVPIRVRWTNHLPLTHLLEEAIDHTLHMAHAEEGVPAVAHLHGGEVEPGSDGGPDAWFTQGFAEKGMGWQKEVYEYANDQLPATLWYHDHALGITRLNVYAGLAGFYLLRDPAIEDPLNLPRGDHEIPLVIQDRMFDEDGQLDYPVGGDNPEVHPLWQPEFFGDVILVNGKVWPYLEVEPRKYRFRILDGSNARFYSLWLVDQATKQPGPAFWQIGSDGGYLDTPVMLNDPSTGSPNRLVLAPGERADVIIDFSGYAPGTQFLMRNNAKSPFPNGETVDPQTTGQIMQFRVVESTGPDESSIATPGPGYVTRVIVRFAPQAGTPDFAFDATAEPGYVWHCHILEHEDNEMMRPYRLVAPGAPHPTMAGPVSAAVAPVAFALHAGPNPTTAGANIHLSLPQAGPATLRVFDLGGRLVRGLADGAFAAGTTDVRWDGRDDAGRLVPTGIYFVTVDGPVGRRTTKLVVAR